MYELERVGGRPAFGGWLRTYLRDCRFGAMTTEAFEAHIEAALPGTLEQAARGHGSVAKACRRAELPCCRLASTRSRGRRGALPPSQVAAAWSATEWNLYLETVPRLAPDATLRALDPQLTSR